MRLIKYQTGACEERIQALCSSNSGGVLIGYEDGDATIIVGAAVVPSNGAVALNALLPAPLKAVGSLGYSSTAALSVTVGPSGALTFAGPGGSAVPAVEQLPPDHLQRTRSLVRCALDLPIEVSSDSSVSAAVQDWKAALCGPDVTFLVDSTAQPCIVGEEPIGEASWARPLVLRLLCHRRTAQPTAPAADIQPSAKSVRWSAVRLDVLAYVPPAASTAVAAQNFVVPALAAQLAAAQTDLEARNELPMPLQALHFVPPGLAHHLTVLYPLPTSCSEADEAGLAPKRAALHAAFGLPEDRPLLRVANAVDPGAAADPSADGSKAKQAQQRLRNVHEGLAVPGVPGGAVHLIRGDYEYFHYMQDSMDDSGWGCAYRSLQTICSWFQRQHYTAKAPPSHREIQSTLVGLGDKPVEFMGSKQWIGAIELGFVLDSLLGVECKVLTVASGKDMASKAREIANHFDSQGTPIMMGGGVLAYTLLGIDYNESSGECAFLILDPHYTGAEDISRIRSGQWVAWKRPGDKASAGGELFASTFYNLLCPQRPKMV